MVANKSLRIHKIVKNIATTGATIAWVSIAIVTFIDVLGRELFSLPISGGYEIIQLLMSIGIFFSIPLVTLHKSHVSVDLFTHLLPSKWVNRIDVLSKVIGTLFFGLITYCLYLFMLHAFSTGVVTTYLRIPHAVVSVLMFLLLILTTLSSVFSDKHDEDDNNNTTSNEV